MNLIFKHISEAFLALLGIFLIFLAVNVLQNTHFYHEILCDESECTHTRVDKTYDYSGDKIVESESIVYDCNKWDNEETDDMIYHEGSRTMLVYVFLMILKVAVVIITIIMYVTRHGNFESDPTQMPSYNLYRQKYEREEHNKNEY